MPHSPILPPEPSGFRVLLADDHALFRQGVRALLQLDGYDVVGEAGDGSELVRLARELKPDVAVVDVSMPLLNGVDATRELRSAVPETKTLLLTMHAERCLVLRALEAGAKGYILKTQPAVDLEQAIDAVARGESYLSPAVSRAVVDAALGKSGDASDPLTPRERQVLQLIAEGLTTRAMADLLGVSVKTAETHRTRLMKKLDIHETAGLVRYAIRNGIASA
jgi:DNA-binding NarL/FixJ family response regulator